MLRSLSLSLVLERERVRKRGKGEEACCHLLYRIVKVRNSVGCRERESES